VYFVSLFLQEVLHFSPLLTGAALIPSTLTVVAMSTLVTRRLLRRLPGWQVLLAGLACLAAGQLWLSQVSGSATYLQVVLPGLILTSMGIGLSLPTAAIAITAGVRREDQGLAGALFTTGQQAGAAVGLAVLATVAASRTAHAAGSLVAGYRLSFLTGAAFIALAIPIVAVQMRPRDAVRHPVLHEAASAAPAPVSLAETQLRNC
jgi:MFS family permease